MVISIISLLSSAVLTALSNARNSARIAANKRFEQSIRSSVSDCSVAFYNFEGSSDSMVQEAGGSGPDGLINGDPQRVESVEGLGQAMEFDGNDDFIEIPDRTTQASVTVSAWVQWSGGSEKDSIIGGGFTISPDTTELDLRVFSDGSVDWSTWDGDAGHGFRPSSYTLPTDTWTHVTGVYDADDEEYRLFIDGTRKDTRVDSYGPADADNDAPWSIGAVYDNRNGSGFLQYFNGKIDNVRIYNCPFQSSS